MTTADLTTSSPVPPPGGTATLAGRPVARVGYGAMQLEQQRVPRDAAVAVLRRVVRAGVNHIDTAEFYGECNSFIRDALAPYADDLVLVSKVGAVRDAGGALIPAQRPAQLRAQVEANLASLGAERVDVVYLRRRDQRVDLDGQLAELTALRDEGKIGAIGLSAVSTDRLRQALPAGIACVQNMYSLLDRSDEPTLDLCREHDIAWIPFFPLGSGMPGRAKVTDNPTVIAIAKEQAVTPAQVALAWLLAHYDKTLLIPGTASPAHLAENLAAGSVRLSPESIAEIDRLAPPP
jgi:pyridoxine 4-dehydrogenase